LSSFSSEFGAFSALALTSNMATAADAMRMSVRLNRSIVSVPFRSDGDDPPRPRWDALVVRREPPEGPPCFGKTPLVETPVDVAESTGSKRVGLCDALRNSTILATRQFRWESAKSSRTGGNAGAHGVEKSQRSARKSVAATSPKHRGKAPISQDEPRMARGLPHSEGGWSGAARV
jgi:hypothetical protein